MLKRAEPLYCDCAARCALIQSCTNRDRSSLHTTCSPILSLFASMLVCSMRIEASENKPSR